MSPSTLVLGIGNILWSDEGFGVRAVEALHRRWRFPDTVRLMDGGTRGLYLVQYVQEAERLLIFDAVDYGQKPGSVVLVENDDVPRFMGVRKMSLHQTGFQEVLAAASLTGRYPRELFLVGMQPLELDLYGGSLTGPVRNNLERSLEIGLERLRKWGIDAIPRTHPLAPEEELLSPLVGLEAYDGGRGPEI